MSVIDRLAFLRL